MLIGVMIANAFSCFVFGFVFAFAPAMVSNFLGSPPETLIRMIGVALIGNGLLLLLASHRDDLRPKLLPLFILGDFSWVAATLFLCLSGIWIVTTTGIVVTLLVAAMVGAFGVAQWKLSSSINKTAG